MDTTQQQLADMGLADATPQPVEPVTPTPQPEPQPAEPTTPEPIQPEPTPTPEGQESYERLQARLKFVQTRHQQLLDDLKLNNPDLVEQYRQQAFEKRKAVEPPAPSPEDPNEDYESRIVKLAQQGVRQELQQERLRLQIEADAREGEQMWQTYIQQAQPSQEVLNQAIEYVKRNYGIDFYAPGGPQRIARAIFDITDKIELSNHLSQRETQAAAVAAAKAKAIATTTIPDGQPAPAPDSRPKTRQQKDLESMGLWNNNIRTP